MGDGTVEKAGWGNGFGNMVVIRHSGGLESMYSHLSGFATGAKRGSRVRQGQVIGYVGATGYATGLHLDFGLKQNGKYVNPSKVIVPRGDSVSRERMAAFKRERDRVREYLAGNGTSPRMSGEAGGEETFFRKFPPLPELSLPSFKDF